MALFICGRWQRSMDWIGVIAMDVVDGSITWRWCSGSTMRCDAMRCKCVIGIGIPYESILTPGFISDGMSMSLILIQYSLVLRLYRVCYVYSLIYNSLQTNRPTNSPSASRHVPQHDALPLRHQAPQRHQYPSGKGNCTAGCGRVG